MADRIDFPKLRERFGKLERGPGAEIKRVANPEELGARPAFYRLTSGLKPGEGLRRVVFCLPWVAHAEGKRLGAELASAKINERRLFQVMRSSYPNDVIQLRRLLQHARPTVDWSNLGPILLRWSREDKRRVLEDYYLKGSRVDSEEACLMRKEGTGT
jgi:CRISPR system Cascade subunit CasB